MDRLERHGHTWVIAGLDELDSASPTPIACLVGLCRGALPAHAATFVETLAKQGCRLFCFVGPASESVHDSFDRVVEDKELFEVVTTWHSGVAGWSDAVSKLYAQESGIVFCVILDREDMNARRLRDAIEKWPVP